MHWGEYLIQRGYVYVLQHAPHTCTLSAPTFSSRRTFSALHVSTRLHVLLQTQRMSPRCRLRTCGHFRLSSTQLVAFLVLHVQPHRCLRSCLSAFYAHVRLSGPRPHRQIKRSFCYEDPGCCTTRRIQRTTTDGPTHAALTPRCSVKFGATSTLPTHPTAHPASPNGRLLHEAQPGQRPSHGQDLLPYTMPGAQRHATCRVRCPEPLTWLGAPIRRRDTYRCIYHSKISCQTNLPLLYHTCIMMEYIIQCLFTSSVRPHN